MNQDIPQQEMKVTAPAKPKSPDNLDEIIKSISQDFKEVAPLHSFAAILGIETGQLVLGVIIVGFFLTIIGAGSGVVTFVVGMWYPIFMSIEAIKNKDKGQSKQWISYWILFESLFLFDGLIQRLFSSFAALYHPLKTMFLVWMYYPRTQGATLIYDMFIIKNLRQFGLMDFKKEQ